MFTCEICGKEFKRERTLQLHKIREKIAANTDHFLSPDEIRREVAIRRGGVIDIEEKANVNIS